MAAMAEGEGSAALMRRTVSLRWVPSKGPAGIQVGTCRSRPQGGHSQLDEDVKRMDGTEGDGATARHVN